MKLTQEQLYWLDTHGGRTIEDVKTDDSGFFVLMGSRRGKYNGCKVVHIPKIIKIPKLWKKQYQRLMKITN